MWLTRLCVGRWCSDERRNQANSWTRWGRNLVRFSREIHGIRRKNTSVTFASGWWLVGGSCQPFSDSCFQVLLSWWENSNTRLSILWQLYRFFAVFDQIRESSSLSQSASVYCGLCNHFIHCVRWIRLYPCRVSCIWPPTRAVKLTIAACKWWNMLSKCIYNAG